MYAIYQLNNKYLAVDAQFISGILKKESIYPLPNAPDCLVGIKSIKGQLYSVIDIFSINKTASTVPIFNYVLRIKSPHNFLLTAATKPVLVESTGKMLNIEPDEDIAPFTKKIFYHDNQTVHLLNIISLDKILKNAYSDSKANKEER